MKFHGQNFRDIYIYIYIFFLGGGLGMENEFSTWVRNVKVKDGNG